MYLIKLRICRVIHKSWCIKTEINVRQIHMPIILLNGTN